MKVIVFDIGGTLMKYRGMPNVWLEFYEEAFAYVNSKLNLKLSEAEINKSLEILRNYNPRVNYREKEYTPELIFTDVTKHWQADFRLEDIIDAFFASMKLTPYIYDETADVLESLRADGYKVATLTDVATGMPDGIITVERRASRPSRVEDLIGTPITGSVVCAARTPPRCAALPAAAMITPNPFSFVFIISSHDMLS